MAVMAVVVVAAETLAQVLTAVEARLPFMPSITEQAVYFLIVMQARLLALAGMAAMESLAKAGMPELRVVPTTAVTKTTEEATAGRAELEATVAAAEMEPMALQLIWQWYRAVAFRSMGQTMEWDLTTPLCLT
jgi:hypothetical protein